ncbi:hypothetical protein M3J09_002541 [Ascochyta lentis]
MFNHDHTMDPTLGRRRLLKPGIATGYLRLELTRIHEHIATLSILGQIQIDPNQTAKEDTTRACGNR